LSPAVVHVIRRPVDRDGRPFFTEAFFLRVANAAPRHPPCFESAADWHEWLALAGSSCDRQLRPFEGGEFNTRVDFCKDCDNAYRGRQRAAGRCHPRWLVDGLHAEPL
jgi:hypothetical protein